MFENYTTSARRAILFARYEASVYGAPELDAEHLLLGLLRENDFLQRNVSSAIIRKAIEKQTPPRPSSSTSVDMLLSQAVVRIIAYSSEESERLGQREANCLHLALGVIREENSLAAKLLHDQGFGREAILKHLLDTNAQSLSALPAKRLAAQLSDNRARVMGITQEEAGNKLEFYPLTRAQALGFLIQLATAHHPLFARALVEPGISAEALPTSESAMAQHYELLPISQLADLWVKLNELLVHVLSHVPPDKWNTPCRIGSDAEIPLSQLVDAFVQTQEDVLGQILWYF